MATVQLRFDGWVTELDDKEKRNDVTSDYSKGKAPGLDNLLYTADADFSCFADLALTSPSSDYYKPGEVGGLDFHFFIFFVDRRCDWFVWLVGWVRLLPPPCFKEFRSNVQGVVL